MQIRSPGQTSIYGADESLRGSYSEYKFLTR